MAVKVPLVVHVILVLTDLLVVPVLEDKKYLDL
jgi:hypothetical protein